MKTKQEQEAAAEPVTEQTELAQSPEAETAITSASDMAEFFGEPDVPQGSLPPQIKILKESAQFSLGAEQLEKSLMGHILFIQPHNVWYEGEFDPTNPEPPMCSSSDAVRPDSGSDPQSKFCAACPRNKHNPELGHRECQNRVLLYVLIVGDAFPSILDLSATNLSKKAGENRIMTFAARAMNKANAAGLGKHFEPVITELSLNQVQFANGPASTLSVECMDVQTDREELRGLGAMKRRIKAEYRAVLGAMDEQAMAGDADVEPEGDGDDIPI